MFSYTEVNGLVRKDYDGLDYADREEMKRDAWLRFSEADTPQRKANAVEHVITAHYDRSREAYRGKHPDFAEYARHWLYANAEHFNLPPDVIAILQGKYPSPKSPRIGRGYTYWKSPAQVKLDAIKRK